MRRHAPRTTIATAASTALALVAGCGAKEPPLSNVGVSEPRIDREPPAEHPPDAGPTWELADQVSSWRVLGHGYRARGHLDGRSLAELRANPIAAGPLASLSPSAHLPEGSVLVEALAAGGASKGPHAGGVSQGPPAGDAGVRGPTFAMVKHPSGYAPATGDWEFVVVGADGIVESRGPEPLCARCHAEALADFVFPLPVDAR